MSLADVIGRMRPITLTVSRDNVTVVAGLAVLGVPTTFSISASVQPVNNKSLRDMPEGQSIDDTLVLWTTTELKLRTATTAPDVVTINGATYRTTKATLYAIRGNFYRCYVEKIDVP